MMTVVTRVRLQPGQEEAWDAAFRRRIANVQEQPGWIAVQLGAAKLDPCSGSETRPGRRGRHEGSARGVRKILGFRSDDECKPRTPRPFRSRCAKA